MSSREKETATEAAELAFRLLEDLCVSESTEPIATQLWKDIAAEALHHEVQGLLLGIAEGTIPVGQSRLREATSALVEIVKTWDLPRRRNVQEHTPFDKYCWTLRSVLYSCGGRGLGIEGLHFDPRQRLRSGTTRPLP